MKQDLKKKQPKNKVIKIKAVAKPKKSKVKIEKTTEYEISEPSASTVVVTIEPRIFEGISILNICGDGHTDKFYLCKMVDGTTRHVPKELIDNV